MKQKFKQNDLVYVGGEGDEIYKFHSYKNKYENIQWVYVTYRLGTIISRESSLTKIPKKDLERKVNNLKWLLNFIENND
jgi:hypothetical protein